MRFSRIAMMVFFVLFIPSGFFLPAPCLFGYGTAAVSIGTIIDTVGMVNDHTTLSQASGSYANGSSMMYGDSAMTNGGKMTMTKKVASGGSDAVSGPVDADKILTFDSAGTGSHLAVHESSITRSSGSSSTAGAPGCSFGQGSSSDSNHSASAAASLDVVGAGSLQLSSSTHLSPGVLDYHVSANNTPLSGNQSVSSAIISSFTFGKEKPGEEDRVSERSMVVGLFDLFDRIYHGSDDGSVHAQTSGEGMVYSRTINEHIYEDMNGSGSGPGWSGSSVYAADVLTNGGRFDEIRSLSSGERIQSDRIITYRTFESSSMQSEERVVAVKVVPSATDTYGDIRCVFARAVGSSEDGLSYQSAQVSSLLFGIDSAQSASTASVDLGNSRNGTMPVELDYRADIISPVHFDRQIAQAMTDPDMDGLYEDLNGNNRVDMQDLVLLFGNFEWLSTGSLSPRFDFNRNGRVDLADLTRAFRDMGDVQSGG